MALSKGTRLDPYDIVIEKHIGQGLGGMADVYLAFHKRYGQVVVKIARGDAEAYDNALRVEAMALEHLQEGGGHPGIVKILPLQDAVAQGQRPLFRSKIRFKKEGIAPSLIMLEYLPGDSLIQVLNQKKHLEQGWLYSLFIHLAEAVAFIHERGYTHLDLKPENVVFRQPGDPPREPVLIDFGIARPIGHPEMLGYDRRYCSPERLQAKNEGRAIEAIPAMDVYSLGVMFYYMLKGTLPPQQMTRSITSLITKGVTSLTSSSEPKHEIPQEMQDLITQMLAPTPEERPSARDVADTLREIRTEQGFETTWAPSPAPSTSTILPDTSGSSSPARSSTPTPTPKPKSRRKKYSRPLWHYLVLGGSLLTVLIFLFFLFAPSPEAGSSPQEPPPVGPQIISGREAEESSESSESPRTPSETEKVPAIIVATSTPLPTSTPTQ